MLQDTAAHGHNREMDTFTCSDGRIVELDWRDDEMVVWTTGSSRERIGSIVFDYIEGADERVSGDYCLVTNMHLEGPNGSRSFLGQGIGTQIIKQVGEWTPIAFSPDDGRKRDDGSHLTGMGPDFARKMVKRGLAFFDE